MVRCNRVRKTIKKINVKNLIKQLKTSQLNQYSPNQQQQYILKGILIYCRYCFQNYLLYKQQVHILYAEFVETEKNQIAKNFLENQGFLRVSEDKSVFQKLRKFKCDIDGTLYSIKMESKNE